MIYSDYNQDESYTPNKVAVRAGTNYHDLQVFLFFFFFYVFVFNFLICNIKIKKEVQVIEFPEPHGWISIPVSAVDAG